MTARTPLYYDGTDLVEFSSSEIAEYVTQAIYQYASNPSVTVTVNTGGGGFATLSDTRFRSSAATQQVSSHATAGSLSTVTTNYTRLVQSKASVSVSGDTNNVAFPVYYDSGTGSIQSMTQTDFVDTFIKPAIDRMVAATEANAGDYGGTFTINNSTSLANHTLISSDVVFQDTRANSGSFTAGQIGTSGTFQDHSTTVANYYLHRRDAVDNSPARTLLFIDNSTNNLNQYSEADIESLLAEYVRNLAVSDTVAADHQIDYNINGSGDQRGSSMTDTKLNGSGTTGQNQVNNDDYRSQLFPNGSATTISTFNFKINKS